MVASAAPRPQRRSPASHGRSPFYVGLPERRRRRRFPGIGGTVLVLAALLTVGAAGLSRRLARYRLAGAAVVACAVFLFTGASVYAVVLPQAGVHVPGQNTIQHLMSRLPVPWKSPRPVYVAAPETTALEAIKGVGVAQPAQPVVAQAGTPVRGDGSLARAGDVVTIGDVPVSLQTAPPASPDLPPLPPATKLEGISHQWQTWNNCGPATITMTASYFGRAQGQTQAMNFMKTNPNDKNVRPDEMVAYVRSLGLQADWRAGGDRKRLQQLLANGIPVVVELGYTPEPNDWMGHYRLLVGYDDGTGKFVAYDSVEKPGVNLSQPYGKFDEDWRIFNRTYIPVYRPEQAQLVDRILGRDREDKEMFERALSTAQAEAAAQPDNPFAWFNVGTNLVALGRAAEAVPAFDRARSLRLPFRMLWYQFGLFDAYLEVNRHADVLSLANANLQQTKDLEESHYYRGRALQAQGQTEAARASYQAALRANGRYAPASHALTTL